MARRRVLQPSVLTSSPMDREGDFREGELRQHRVAASELDRPKVVSAWKDYPIEFLQGKRYFLIPEGKKADVARWGSMLVRIK